MRRRPNTKGRRTRRAFSTVHPDAAGIDVGSRFHVVAVAADRDPEPVRTFSSFTHELHRLADWLAAVGISTVAMESTGVYWIPVFEILEARGFEVLLVNARHVKHVPGRKTDVTDAQWIQQLHQFGLLRGSFRPVQAVVALRAYLRQRERLLQYAAAHIQHMQKALTQMNVQLHHESPDSRPAGDRARPCRPIQRRLQGCDKGLLGDRIGPWPPGRRHHAGAQLAHHLFPDFAVSRVRHGHRVQREPPASKPLVVARHAVPVEKRLIGLGQRRRGPGR